MPTRGTRLTYRPLRVQTTFQGRRLKYYAHPQPDVIKIRMTGREGGEAWQEYRRKLGLSQQEIHDRTGTPKSGLSNRESGQKNPRMDLLFREADALGYDVYFEWRKKSYLSEESDG